MCRAFLWSGEYFIERPGLVAWEKVCAFKNVGGLGFRDVITWDIASLGKYVWVISTKQDSVWFHCWIVPKGGGVGFYCSLIYAFNSTNERESLWRDLTVLAERVSDAWCEWVILIVF